MRLVLYLGNIYYTGYRIEQKTKTASMENDYIVEEAIVFRNRIKNATLLSNSEYIAKKVVR